MPNRCKICTNEITEGQLRDHLINNHGGHAASVERAYPELYGELFVDGQLREDVQAPPPGQSDGDTTPPGDRQQAETAGGTDTPSGRVRGSAGSGPTSGQSRSPSRTQSTGRADDQSRGRASRGSIDRGTSKKWLMVGIGGAGNHILDAILMRRDTLIEQNRALADVWEGGIADYLNLNTNRSEVYETYYAQIDKEYSPESLVSNCMIGHNQHAYSGAGRDWKRGRDFMQHDFEDEQNAFVERWDVDRQSLGGAQAIMLIHSVTKGTGCGATPVLADNLREMLESSGPDGRGAGVKPILSSVVLPSRDEFGGSEMVRGVIGMARLSKAADGVLPFDNAQLERIRSDLAVDIDRQWLETYNPPKYEDINRLLVSFFEGFTMSSTPISYDASATKRISGDVFDVPDSIRPAVQKYPVDSELDYDPAVVMVPVLGRHDSPTDENDLDTLVRSTLLQGQFIDFEPDTAWGGTFMIYGPEEQMDDLSPLLMDNQLKRILGGEDFLDRGSTGPGESVDVYVDQLVVPQVDSVHLWGLVWNPQLPTLNDMYEHAEELVSNSNSRQAKALDDIWNYVEPVFGHLGRENMG
ncbi:cell division protein FtsZ [Halovenus salina]|uniref:Cell division protein FtsZ n=1 Tax=Halovenus salina TaxID=1510225 RepID=A0ABD5W281_9EURY|nr:cell division protein FtsZ [Halovenus salina]